MKHRLVSYALMASLAAAGCSSEKEPVRTSSPEPAKPAVSKPLTYDLLEYRVRRGDTLTDITDDLLKEETSRSGQRVNFGNRFELEFDSDYHGHASPTGLLCEINGFGDACDSFYFDGVELKIGQRLAIPDLNGDKKIGGKEARQIGKLDVIIHSPTGVQLSNALPVRILVNVDEYRRTYGAGHPLAGTVEYKKNKPMLDMRANPRLNQA